MPRELPDVSLERPMRAKAYWRPSGDHLCQVAIGYSEISLRVGEVDRMIAALQAFKTEQTFEDGRPSERTHDAFKALGEF
ncbi:MAG: hypothetical protein KKB37_11240 [Alphaproteobacteria bacterium]|nr:hypothetical protein [Alphaproteobacteria bacterium]